MIPFKLSWGLIAVAFLKVGVAPDRISVQHFSAQGVSHPLLMTGKPGGALRVLVGGALAPGPSEQEGFMAEVLESSGVDAVAVGYPDLSAQGPDRRALLSREKIPFVCANVKGAGRPYVVRSIGKTRVAFLGVTKVPGHLKDFQTAAGWTIEDPAARVKALLPALAQEADLVVLLAVMDRLDCADLVRSVEGIHLALVPAGSSVDPEPLRVGGTTLVQSSATPARFSQTTLAAEVKNVPTVSNEVESVELSEADQARAKALRSKYKEGVDLERLVAGITLAPPPGPVKETGPLTVLEPGKLQPLVVQRSNGSVEIRIESVQVLPELGGRKAPQNGAWLIVRSEWKNTIPKTDAGGRLLSTVYSIADAKNNLYVIADGRSLCSLDVELSGGAEGLLSGSSIGIQREGQTKKGSLVFPVPSGALKTLDLQFYDFLHDPMTFSLLGRPDGSSEKPLVPLVKNEILEVGVFRVTRGKAENAAEGMGYARVDLRVRSLVTVDAGSSKVGMLGDLEDAWAGLRLATEGGKEFEPEKGLPPVSRFLPGALTGQEILFLIPEKAMNLELRWSLPEIGLPSGVVKPALLRIPLGGKPVAGLACPKCGEPFDPGDKFCSKCGTKLKP